MGMTEQLVLTDAPCRSPETPPGPREAMASLPAWLQQPLTIFTGKALPGQRAPRRWTPAYHLFASCAWLLGGLSISALAWDKQTWWLALLPFGWGTSVHGLRNLRMLIFHQCSHANMFRRRGLDRWIGELLAAVLVVQNFERYRQEHVVDHHAGHHMTLRDPTVQAFLLTLQLRPGMPVNAMRRRVFRKVVSPLFHLRFAAARARSFWTGPSRREAVTGAIVHGAVLVGAWLSGRWLAVAIAWWVPLFPLFQVSNVLRLCVKHNFPPPGAPRRRGKEYIGSLTTAVFIGEAPPHPSLRGLTRVARWALWGARMLFVHGPARLIVITADTPVHDWHHRYPSAPHWAHHLYLRQADIDRGCQGWPPYTESWGLSRAMARTFKTLSDASPEEFDPALIAQVSRRGLYLAFDD